MKIAANNAELWFYPNFIKSGQSRKLFEYLHTAISWQQDSLSMYGKLVDIPRLQAWFGESNAQYAYSGLTLAPKPWLPVLEKMKNTLNEQCNDIVTHSSDVPFNDVAANNNHLNAQNVNFNSMMANCYRDNNDAVAWHSDDEPELGKQPVIASVSLGATRIFKLKHKVSGEKLDIPLTSGSLLIMAGETQHCWQHAILRSKKAIAPRINLTFREIKPIV